MEIRGNFSLLEYPTANSESSSGFVIATHAVKPFFSLRFCAFIFYSCYCFDSLNIEHRCNYYVLMRSRASIFFCCFKMRTIVCAGNSHYRMHTIYPVIPIEYNKVYKSHIDICPRCGVPTTHNYIHNISRNLNICHLDHFRFWIIIYIIMHRYTLTQATVILIQPNACSCYAYA